MNCFVYFNFLISLSMLINEKNISYNAQEKQKIVYIDGQIKIIGFSGEGKIQVYTIIGNQILDIKVRELKSYVFNFKINPSNLYILRIYNNNMYKSFKFTVP